MEGISHHAAVKLADIRRLGRDNPFFTLGIIAWAMLALGEMPAGHDYDPHPVRTALRAVYPFVAFPFLVGIAVALSVREGTFAVLLGMGLGFATYMLADLFYRTRR